MRKSFKEFNSTHNIIGDVECNEFMYRQFIFLTQGEKEKEDVFTLILDEVGGNIWSAISEIKRRFAKLGVRGNVTLEQLQITKAKEELYNLIDEMFLNKFADCQIDELLNSFSIEQLYRFSQNNPLQNPIRLLTFNREYAISRFSLN